MRTFTVSDQASAPDSQASAPISDFCGFLEQRAACLADKGWTTEAFLFRKWLSELRVRNLCRS